MLAPANRTTAVTTVTKYNEPFREKEGFNIYTPTRSVGSKTLDFVMGATGFEPVATWSEAKHSVQTELSALHDFVCRGLL